MGRQQQRPAPAPAPDPGPACCAPPSPPPLPRLYKKGYTAMLHYCILLSLFFAAAYKHEVGGQAPAGPRRPQQ